MSLVSFPHSLWIQSWGSSLGVQSQVQSLTSWTAGLESSADQLCCRNVQPANRQDNDYLNIIVISLWQYFPEIDKFKETIGFSCPVSKLKSTEGKRFSMGPETQSFRLGNPKSPPLVIVINLSILWKTREHSTGICACSHQSTTALLYLFQNHSMSVEFACCTSCLLYLGRNSKSQSWELSDFPHECYKPVSIMDS